MLSLFRSLGDLPEGPFPQLTGLEWEILDHMARGASNQELASLLGLSPKIIRNNVSAIYGKLQVAGRRQAIIAAREARPGIPCPRRTGG